MYKEITFLKSSLIFLLASFSFINLTRAEDILPGQYKTGSISPGKIDTYTFYANAGDSITILMGEITGETDFYPRLELHGPDGTVIDVDWQINSATIQSATVNQSGTCYIIARDNEGNHSGTYGLSMIRNPGTISNDPNDDSVPILPGQYKTGSILKGDLDAYTFYANAGDSITILMGEISGETNFYPRVELHGPDGTVIDVDWQINSATIQSATVNQSGTCYIIARDNEGNHSGTYGLSMIRNPGTTSNDPNDDSVPILPGQYKTGSILKGDIDAYTFYANAGDSITILMGEITGETDFYPRLELHGPDGTVIDVDWQINSATIQSATVNQSGTCYIIARDNEGNHSGTYGLSMIRNPGTTSNDPNDDSVPILPGQYKTGSILKGDLDAYTFYANAGDSITIEMGEVNGETNFYPRVELHGPDGTVIDVDWQINSATIQSATVNQSGTCYIIARDNEGNHSGTYGLSMSRVYIGGTPSITSISDSPDPVLQGQLLTLTAAGVSDSDGSVVQVDFYRDLNRNGYLDLDGSDQLLGTDYSSAGGWLWQGEISGSQLIGLNRYFARVKDNLNLWSNYVSCTGTITPLFNGDFDNDNDVDWLDLSTFTRNWLKNNCDSPDWCQGTDFDMNHNVNALDFARFAQYWLL